MGAWGVGCLLVQGMGSWCHAAGTIVAWGANDSLQSQPPVGLSNVVAVAGGEEHSLAVRSNGTVVAWGFNASGQTNVPPGLTGVRAVGGGSAYSMALTTNNAIVVWGTAPGGLTNNSPSSNYTAIAAGWYHALALKTDGTVAAWGAQTNRPPTGLSNVVAIAAGKDVSLALLAGGTVVAWGDNSYGKTNVPPGATNITAIAAGGDHCLALTRDEKVLAWGRNDSGQATVPANLIAVAIAAGALHSVAERADSTLLAWGDNSLNQTVVNTNISGFIALAAGGYHSLAIKGDGTPIILTQPYSQSILIGQSVTFQVVATGAAPLTYQWFKNGTNFPNTVLIPTTNAVLTIPNIQLTDAGVYSVQVANSFGAPMSVGVTLTPLGGVPVIAGPPQNTNVVCGDNALFQISAGGTAPFSYQWQFGGTNLPGATASSLLLVNVTPSQQGFYTVLVTNAFGSIATGAVLTVTIQPPHITSSLNASGGQGQPFSYTITAIHNPQRFAAQYLPAGLTITTNTGVISGTPTENGSFGVLITAYNACTSDSQTLLLSLASSVPVITSPLTANATEGSAMAAYQITATHSPTSFGAQNLPVGLNFNPASGVISGTPVYAGSYTIPISASNQWGIGSAVLQLTVGNAAISGLSIDNRTFTYKYHTPYLLDFMFTLRDNNSPGQGNGIVTDPSLLSAVCMEDFINGTVQADYPNLPTGTTMTTNLVAETGIFIGRGSDKVFKAHLVLDFSDSISDPTLNGDSNGDGISDAVDNMVGGAQYFVDQQPGAAQMGVFEFHRDDVAPNKVIGLTRNKQALDAAIAGIWTNYVNFFYAGSRCWDAVDAAVLDLGASNPDEQHYVIFVSDGLDYSSLITVNQVIADARAGGVQVYCIAFGNNPDINTLQSITSATRGMLYIAQSPTDLFQQFSLVSKDVQAQYDLRWATLRRSPADTFAPFFLLSYQGLQASPPWWDWNYVTNIFTNIMISTDTNTPSTTNYTTNIVILWSDTVMGPFNPIGYDASGAPTNGGFTTSDPSTHVGGVTNGTLRMVKDEDVHPSGLTIRATYIPRFVRQLRFNYRPNWPCTPVLEATNPGEMLHGWTLTPSNAPDGSTWVLLSSPNPQSQTNSLPFAGFGPLMTLKFQDVLANPSNALSSIKVDNSIYTNIIAGGQVFSFETGSTNPFVTYYPPLLHNTSVPWLIMYFPGTPANSNAWQTLELADSDNDRAPNWMEFRANTVPTNAASAFRITGLVRQLDGRFAITFTTSTNRTYRVDSSANLINWAPVQDGIPGTNTPYTVIDTTVNPGLQQIYYRVVVY